MIAFIVRDCRVIRLTRRLRRNVRRVGRASQTLIFAACFCLLQPLGDRGAREVARASAPSPETQQNPAAPREAQAPPSRLLAETLARVKPTAIRDSLERLLKFPTRHTRSPQNVEAAAWLRDQFKSLGYEDVAFHQFKLGDLTRSNVVCVKPGSADRKKVLIVCAHYDSRTEDLDDAQSPAPGADDNASGVSVLLETARVVREIPTATTIYFVAFSGEEQGLVGSSAYARSARAAKLPISLVINIDMVGHPADPARPAVIIEQDVGNARRENDAPSRAFAAGSVRAAGVTRLATKLGPIYGSDYMPFERLGISCIGLFDGADNQPFYHKGSDVIGTVDTAYSADVCRLLLATILDVDGKL
jgi:Peptidase family M28